MAKRKTFALNKDLQAGLTQTMSAVRQYGGDLRFEIVPLSQIELDPDNPRDLAIEFIDLPQGPKQNDPDYARKMQEIETLNTLAHTINKQGIINPVVVFKHGNKYRLVAGERRCLASIIAGKSDIKANILSERPPALRQRLLQWIENIEREDLCLWERLQNIKMILEAYQAQASEPEPISSTLIKNLLGCSSTQAVNYYIVLMTDESILTRIRHKEINNLEKAALIVKAANKDLQNNLLAQCAAGASLAQMKRFIQTQAIALKENKKQKLQAKLSKGRGRKTDRINLGFINDVTAVRTIFTAVLEQDKFRHYHSRFDDLDWNDLNAVSLAFKEFLMIIESVNAR